MGIKNKTHLKNKIIQMLRKLTWQWNPIKEAEDKAKVDAATFECKMCGKYVYKGTSKKSFEALVEKYPDKVVEMGKIYRDHITPIIGVDESTKDISFDTLIERMFCEAEHIQILCFDCNKKKTDSENEKRKKK